MQIVDLLIAAILAAGIVWLINRVAKANTRVEVASEIMAVQNSQGEFYIARRNPKGDIDYWLANEKGSWVLDTSKATRYNSLDELEKEIPRVLKREMKDLFDSFKQ